ncbi:MAG: putative porin [Marinoscillum sp.]|uniref:putative porin n=1 Tax=Marinoscillum sp. TaxID=2024838 RepID=UPI003304F8CD
MKKSLSAILLLMSVLSVAQITDDSSELVYGSKTTLIIYESDLKNNQEKERHPDTTLYELEKFTKLDLERRKYQDLGNNGTALFPIFYPAPKQIGRTSGLSAYDPYMINPEQLKYYDSKSPHINLMVVFGGEGRSVVDMAFSRNVNENWNVGFDIYRITSDKQIGKSGQQDRNVVGTVFDLYTYYKHKDKPYNALFHMVNMSYDIEETGGIYVEDLSQATKADLFEYQDSDIQLSEARSNDDRLNFHLYHQYNWTTPLQFYHQFDLKNQEVGFQDFKDVSSGTDLTYGGYYDQFLLGTDSTYERFTWKEMVNEVGIKGDLANIFYRLYLKRRDLDFDNLYQDPTPRFSEMFLGGYTRFDWKDQFNIEAKGELMQSGEYQLTGQLNSDFLFGSYKSVRYKPAFIYEKYFGNHHEWNQTFASAFSNEITAGLQVDLGFLKIRPLGRLLSLDKFFYFDENKTAQQSSDVAIMASLGGDFNFKLYTNKALKEAFHLENEVYYTSISGGGADNMVVPQFFYNGRFFWRGYWFKDTMGVEVGIDVHAKSQYYAMGYAPELQQFHLQREFLIEQFYTADLFLSMKINNLRAFVKMTNINQQSNDGYFVTPYYPGQSQVMDFGVRWMFFD